MNISLYFQLGSQQPKLDFVDIKLETDNLFFIDPRLIEYSQSSYSAEMHFYISSLKACIPDQTLTLNEVLFE